MKMKIEQINISKRIRKDIGNIEYLKDSIKKYGLLSPIIIDKNKNLIAGFRRYQSLKELGIDEVEVKVVPFEDKKTLLEIELHENEMRKSFTKSELEDGESQVKIYSEKNIFLRFFKFLMYKIKNLFKKRKPRKKFYN